MMFVYDVETYEELVGEGRDFLLSLVEAGEGKPVAIKYKGDPAIYEAFVALTCSHTRDLYDHASPNHNRAGFPDALEYELSFVDISLLWEYGDVYKTAREQAEASTTRAYSSWLTAYETNDNHTMQGRVREVRVMNVESGDQDSVGNARTDAAGTNNILWAHIVTIQLVL